MQSNRMVRAADWLRAHISFLCAGISLLGIVAGLQSALAGSPATHADNVGDDDGLNRPDYYRYVEQAYPNGGIAPQQTAAARAAFDAIKDRAGMSNAWRQLNYQTGAVPAPVTYTGRAFTASGRDTALALTPGCASDAAGPCAAYLGAAGGGLWMATSPFGDPSWTEVSKGLRSNAIGAIAVDPNGMGSVLYVGTGEQNSSADSEAGVGLFKSADGGQSWHVVPATVPLSDGLSISAVLVDPRSSDHILFSTMTALHGLSASGNASVPPGTAVPAIYESIDGGKHFTALYQAVANSFNGGIVQMAFDPTDPDTIYASAFNEGIIRSSAKLDGDRSFRLVYTHLAYYAGAPNDNFNRLAFTLTPYGKTVRAYVGDSNDGDATSYIARADNMNQPAYSLTNGSSGNPGYTVLSNPNPGTPGYGSWGFCEGQCWYDTYLAVPPGKVNEVWFGGSMNYDEIFTANPPSNGRAVMRSTDAGISFTDMTRDSRSPAGGMHPDQHVIAFNPKNPNQVLAGSDGGMVLTSGALVDGSSACASRGLSGADLTDCQSWLSLIPTRVAPVNAGLETLQYQGVSYNPAASATDWIGGTQDNGTWTGYAGNKAQQETVGGDGGDSGFDAVLPNIRFHTYYDPQVDVNFNGSAVLGWDWVADPLLASGEASEFYIPIIADPLVSGTIFAGLQHVWRTLDDGGPHAYLQQHCNEYSGDFQVTCGDWQPMGDDLTASGFGSDRTGGELALLSRQATDQGTLWAATNRGRLFISSNAAASDPGSVTFTRLDGETTPNRVVSGVAIDPTNPRHAYVAYTGYAAYTPKMPGHLYDVTLGSGGAVTYRNATGDLGDLPLTALVLDPSTNTLFAGTDFGVIMRKAGNATGMQAGAGLPPVAVFQLKLTPDGLLYAATHGRGIWTLKTR